MYQKQPKLTRLSNEMLKNSSTELQIALLKLFYFILAFNLYNQNKSAVKIGQQRTDYFSQQRGVRQDCCLSPTLFNIYINELADLLDQSDSPGLQLFHTEVKYLLYADDLLILSKTPEGLQNNLDILTKHYHDWTLEVNIQKTKIMILL